MYICLQVITVLESELPHIVDKPLPQAGFAMIYDIRLPQCQCSNPVYALINHIVPEGTSV